MDQSIQTLEKNEHDKDALKYILRCLRAKNRGVRVDAVIALQKVGEAHPRLGPLYMDDLRTALADGDQSVRREAALAVVPIANAETQSLVPALIQRLGEGDNDVAVFAAEALGAYGRVASEAVPSLGDAIGKRARKGNLNVMEKQLAIECARALGRIGDPLAKPYLEFALHSPNESIRASASKALLRLPSLKE